MRRALVGAVIGLALLVSAPALSAQFKDIQLASRVLTDADIEKYVGILAEVRKAQRSIPSISSPAGMEAQRAATVKASEARGWGSGDYGAVDARMRVAEQHIRMEKTTPVPAAKQADVELFRKWQQKVAEARK